MASSEDDMTDKPDELEDDLFGSDDEAPAEKARELSDRELDSGDDVDREDRWLKDTEDGDGGKELRVSETTIWRHPLPNPVDGEVDALRLPTFLGIDPRVYDPESFTPPTSDHHSDSKSANFSASAIAASTMRYRKNLHGELESNAVVYKWSDGSTTIAVGGQQYELQSKPLAPSKDSKTYQEVQDSHQYLASPSIASQLLVIVAHMKNQYSVRPNKEIVDDALERLQLNLAAATRRGNKGGEKGGPEMITNTIDPELQKKKAEIAEKERLRAQRRRETAAEKANLPRGLGGGRGGLSVDDLEGRGRRAPGVGKPRAKAPKRRAEYDSDDDLPRGRNREDEYDKEDDFLASSDEEEEPEADDDEDIIDDESDRGPPKSKKQKVSRHEDDSEADAEADLDDYEVPAAAATSEPAGRGRKRNVIEDDEEDE